MSELTVAEPRQTYSRLPPIVVDCSVLAAILFDEPERDAAANALAGKGLFAPWLLDYEMISVGLKKAATGLTEVALRGLADYAQLRITRRRCDGSSLWKLARDERLTAYDAAYLQLALELNAPLVTYDRTLGVAAERLLGQGR